MKYEDLPEHWKIGPFKYGDFPEEKVIIKFVDWSFATFNNAFWKVCPERNEVAVFTENCGHHIFYLSGVKLSIEEMNRN